MARWLERLQEYDFDIVHRRGRQHQNADSLSRLPCKQCRHENHQIVEPEMVVHAVIPGQSLTDVRQGQLADTSISFVLQAVEDDQNQMQINSRDAVERKRSLFSFGIS